MTRPYRSRRSVLAACGAGLAALAGCSAVDATLGDGEEREYDAGALAALGGEVPTRPDAFPVRVGEEEVERHYDRARELLAAVPERPEVPNGAVAERLRDRRERAVGRLEDRPELPTGPRRLDAARRVRGDAAEVEGAYRAAVGETGRGTVAGRRAELRSDLHSFESEWDYRGGEPSAALVVHAELERLRGTVRRSAEAWPPFPADPAADVFRVGEIVEDLEDGRAALTDAERLRTRYVAGTADPRSFRPAITAASHRLERRASWRRRNVHGALDRPAREAFDRSVEGTPAEHLYSEARQHARRAADDEGTRRTGEHATATLGRATDLAGLRAFEAVVDAVEAGGYGPPEDADRVATAREEAVAALREAWATDPAPVSVEVAEAAHRAIWEGDRRLERTDGRAHEVDAAFASFAYAGLYAEAVPDVVAAVADALGDVG